MHCQLLGTVKIFPASINERARTSDGSSSAKMNLLAIRQGFTEHRGAAPLVLPHPEAKP
jgi:hypothetical protein